MKHTILACSLLLPSSILADDFTVEEKPFKIETTLNAVFLPTQSQPISIKPDAWSDFAIISLAAQGSQVKKGDVLIGIDTEKLDKHIAKVEKGRKAAELNLAQAKQDLAQLEISTPRNLEKASRYAKEMAENLKWYTEIGHAKDIENAKYSVKKAEQGLSYVKEELKQLLKMYNEDNQIEETEEIILTRTRNGVEASELSVKFTRINSENSLKTIIPRKLLGQQLAAKSAKIANDEATEKLPRALEQKRLSVAQAIRDNQKAIKNLAKLKADRKMMLINAPADGVVYYGSINAGRWQAEAATKILKVGGKLPIKTTVMTFIPANSPLELSAFTETSQLSALRAQTPKKTKGFATTDLNPYQNIPVQLTSVAAYPETNGSFRVSLKPTISKDLPVTPGMKAKTRIITHQIDKALKVPKAYLMASAEGGFTVQVKLADGKTDTRTVTPGISNKEWVVITKGLEKGQVLVK